MPLSISSSTYVDDQKLPFEDMEKYEDMNTFFQDDEVSDLPDNEGLTPVTQEKILPSNPSDYDYYKTILLFGLFLFIFFAGYLYWEE